MDEIGGRDAAGGRTPAWTASGSAEERERECEAFLAMLERLRRRDEGESSAGEGGAVMSATLATPTVLNAAEAAEFLRLPVAEVVAAADAGHLPGRRVGAEWRFLREGLADWLRGPVVAAPPIAQWLAAAPRVWDEALQKECDRELAELAAIRKSWGPADPDAAHYDDAEPEPVGPITGLSGGGR